MIKRPDEIDRLAESGRLLAQVFAMLDALPLQGRSTLEINDIVERMIVDDLQARPASKGQYGFPYVLNASIDNVICHGMPSADDVLRSGQIVNLDITLEKNGYIADSSTTYLVGEVDYAARKLVQTSYQAMWKGIAAVRPGARLGDIGHAIARHARSHGYSVVKEYCATVSARRCTRNRRSCTTAMPAPAWNCRKAWCSPSSRCSTKASRRSASSPTNGRCTRATASCRRSSSTPWRSPAVVCVY